MTVRIASTAGDDPELRRILMRELAPMLGPPPGAGASPRWISVGAGAIAGPPQGGLIGLVTGAWLSIDLLWLPEALRGQGIGGRLVAAAERQAAALGCLGAVVGTTSEAARAFYERNGYAPRIVMPEIAPGVTQTVLQKILRDAGDAAPAQPMSRT